MRGVRSPRHKLFPFQASSTVSVDNCPWNCRLCRPTPGGPGRADSASSRSSSISRDAGSHHRPSPGCVAPFCRSASNRCRYSLTSSPPPSFSSGFFFLLRCFRSDSRSWEAGCSPAGLTAALHLGQHPAVLADLLLAVGFPLHHAGQVPGRQGVGAGGGADAVGHRRDRRPRACAPSWKRRASAPCPRWPGRSSDARPGR